MSLPIFQTANKEMMLLQTKWSSEINPLLRAIQVKGFVLEGVKLASGANNIAHFLDRKLNGWYPVRFHGNFAQLFDTQDANPTPDRTLQINASAGVTVDLFVF